MAKKITNRAVIFAGGDVLNYASVSTRLTTNDYIVCADSGYRHCERLKIKPNLLVGDFDSIEEMPQGIERYTLPTNKNYTDSAIAIETVIEKGFNNILLVGMLGGRFDHTFANVQSLVYCINKGIEAYITDGLTDVFCVKTQNNNATFILESREDHYFSLLAYSPVCTKVTIENGVYPLDDYNLSYDEARAVSNEFKGRPVHITFTNGILLIMVVPKYADVGLA